MTREEWLRHAVEKLNANLFNGDLDLLNHEYQVSVGVPTNTYVRKDALYEVYFPYNGEDPTMDDFYPPTIIVSHSIKDPVEMLGALALACIRTFFEHKSENKKFRKHAEEYYFEQVDKKMVPSDYLKSMLNGVYGVMVKEYGDFPGKPVIHHVKESKEGDGEKKKSSLKLFCPDCDYTLKISRKIYEKYKGKVPTCICGTKMAVDLSDEEDGQEKESNE